MPLDLPVLFCLAALSVCIPAVAGQGGDLPPVSQLKPDPNMPDPLVMLNGARVISREQWERERKPELKRLFQHYMYGYMPPKPRKVQATVERENASLFGGKATLREVTLRFAPPPVKPIHLLLIVPNHRTRPAAVFLGIAFCGNQAVVNDPAIRMAEGWMYDGPGVVDHHATEASRGTAADVWNVEQSIDRGYAVATFYNGDIEPDVPNAPDGIRRLLGNRAPAGHEWGAVAAWAWGMSRAVDYLVTVKELDPKRISAVGHSRCGKAAIVAGAFDERIALVIPLQAGCGGTSPSRGTVGESVKAINDHFPHWFDATFKQFNEKPDLLPFDQNCLIALCAPRPVLLSNATQDTWANPAGQFEAERSASAVYRLLDVEGLSASTMPAEGQLVSSRLGYFIRPGKHSMTTVDWKAFVDFADRNLN